MKLLRLNWSKLTLAQSIALSVGVLVVGAVVLFGKRMGIDGEWIKVVGAAGVAVLTAAGFFSNQKGDSDDSDA